MNNSRPPFVEGRLNPGFDEKHFTDALAAIRRAFAERWLQGHKSHPVRDLWKRNDTLASNELFWLGDSILRLMPIDNKWVSDTVERVKSEHRNVRIGHVFELLALAGLATSGQCVSLAPAGNPSFDGDVTMPTGEVYRFSLKNFGASSREGEFKKRCEEIEALVISNARERGLDWCGALLVADIYPKDADWQDLSTGINAAIAGDVVGRVGNCWTLVPSPPPATRDGLAVGQLSFSIFIVAPHHTNERKNFLDKIEKECLAFNKAAASFPSGVHAVVLVRISEAAPIHYYERWVRDYLAKPGVNIDGLILYQSSVAVDLSADTTSMHHYMATIMKAGHSPPLPQMTVVAGLIPGTPSRSLIAAGNKQIPLDEHHWYQHRELFALALLADDGTGAGQMHSMPGSTTHAVLARRGEAGVILSPRQPSFGYLTLFS